MRVEKGLLTVVQDADHRGGEIDMHCGFPGDVAALHGAKMQGSWASTHLIRDAMPL
ncbi:hypothetical protein [Sulfitobacter sp. AS59]|uniref:hypothetical protein n=1 Tax=Sulfitobacter sp. AS59 TaxID=3135784 RepID=UPI0031718F1E